MKTFLPLTLGLAAVFASFPAPQANANSGEPKFDLIVVAEQANPKAPPPMPDPDHPVYYTAADAGYIEAGSPIAGEKPPTAEAVGQALRVTLAAQNYQPAPDGSAPAQLLIYHWGVIRRDFIAIEPPFRVQPNLHARISLVATKKMAERIEDFIVGRKSAVGLGRSFPPPGLLAPRLQDVLSIAEDPRYFVIVSAYDYAAVSRHEPRLLWRVKLSARDVSGAMYEILPALIRGGGPFLGRHVEEPQYLKAPRRPAVAPGEPDLPATAGQPPEGFVRDLAQREHAAFSGEPVADPANNSAAAAATGDPGSPALPPALAQRITTYQREKLSLQETLAARIKGQNPGAETRQAIDTFNAENAGRIAALSKAREAIRDELSRLAAANAGTASGKSLDVLLQEYAIGVQELQPPAAP
ncbi:MAG: hypothetical protein PHE83_10705 [Opitutaceae bacterium]|nr:hypothetical protein [Opitutaceae bacterium]